LKIMEY